MSKVLYVIQKRDQNKYCEESAIKKISLSLSLLLTATKFRRDAKPAAPPPIIATRGRCCKWSCEWESRACSEARSSCVARTRNRSAFVARYSCCFFFFAFVDLWRCLLPTPLKILFGICCCLDGARFNDILRRNDESSMQQTMRKRNQKEWRKKGSGVECLFLLVVMMGWVFENFFLNFKLWKEKKIWKENVMSRRLMTCCNGEVCEGWVKSGLDAKVRCHKKCHKKSRSQL